MTKHTINRLFIGSITAVIAGLVLGFIAVWVAFAGGAFEMNGPDVSGLRQTPFALAMAGLVVAAVLAIVVGAIVGLVSWIGALLNTAQLDDKTWFILLLVLGLWNLGLVAMIAYVVAGPDGAREESRLGAHAGA
jgi:hypothetical protein